MFVQKQIRIFVLVNENSLITALLYEYSLTFANNTTIIVLERSADNENRRFSSKIY